MPARRRLVCEGIDGAAGVASTIADAEKLRGLSVSAVLIGRVARTRSGSPADDAHNTGSPPAEFVPHGCEIPPESQPNGSISQPLYPVMCNSTSDWLTSSQFVLTVQIRASTLKERRNPCWSRLPGAKHPVFRLLTCAPIPDILRGQQVFRSAVRAF